MVFKIKRDDYETVVNECFREELIQEIEENRELEANNNLLPNNNTNNQDVQDQIPDLVESDSEDIEVSFFINVL